MNTGRGRRSPWAIAAIFAVLYILLQGAWIAARGSGFERWLIEDVSVRSSVSLIQMLTPSIGASAHRASIVAPGTRLNVLNGCEGTEILIPLVAALLAYPFAWRTRIVGLLAGTAWVFALNQARMLGLFYAFRDDPTLFGHLHGLVTPLLLILGVVLFFFGVLQWDRRSSASSPSAS
jgi:exosortase/archaeosortase family protein